MVQSTSQTVGVTIFLTVLALVAIMLRFCARRLKKVGLGWDDYTILPAMVSSILYPCVMDLGQNSMTDLGTAFYHRLRNKHLCWSCRRRSRKTRGT